jgi:hypothetical protein
VNTAELWAQQDAHTGDRWRLFTAVAGAVDVTSVLYPGSYVDVAPSFVWPSVTYVDTDRRAQRFFDDVVGVRKIIAAHAASPVEPEVTFVGADYTAALPLPEQGFDLMVSLYAGPISHHCTQHLRIGGWLLVNPSHGDAAMASIDDRYQLDAVVNARAGDYRISRTDLDEYLVPKRGVELTTESILGSGRGIAYTRSPFAYLFRRRH